MTGKSAALLFLSSPEFLVFFFFFPFSFRKFFLVEDIMLPIFYLGYSVQLQEGEERKKLEVRLPDGVYGRDGHRPGEAFQDRKSGCTRCRGGSSVAVSRFSCDSATATGADGPCVHRMGGVSAGFLWQWSCYYHAAGLLPSLFPLPPSLRLGNSCELLDSLHFFARKNSLLVSKNPVSP